MRIVLLTAVSLGLFLPVASSAQECRDWGRKYLGCYIEESLVRSVKKDNGDTFLRGELDACNAACTARAGGVVVIPGLPEPATPIPSIRDVDESDCETTLHVRNEVGGITQGRFTDCDVDEWVKNYRLLTKEGLVDSDIYTRILVENSLEGGGFIGNCSQFSFVSAFGRDLIDLSNERAWTATLVISSDRLNALNADTRGVVVPLAHLSLVKDGPARTCRFDGTLLSDGWLATVRATEEINVTLLMLIHEEDTLDLELDEAVGDLTFFAQVLNGALETASEEVLGTVSELGGTVTRIEQSRVVSRLPVKARMADSGRAWRNAHGVFFRLAYADRNVMDVKVFQDSEIEPEGALTGQRSFTRAINQAKIAAPSSRGVGELSEFSLSQVLAALNVTNLQPSTKEELVEFCSDAEAVLSKYELTDAAMDKLQQLAFSAASTTAQADIEARAACNVDATGSE